jgi:CRP-like cAMP-binding protein
MSTYPKFLREFACFNGVSDEKIEKIAQFSDAVCYPANTLLFREGDVGTKLYFLRSGEVEVLFNIGEEGQVRVDTLSSEDIAGCSALIEPFQYTASERCLTDVEVLEIDNLALRELMEKDCPLGLIIQKQVIKMMMKRILDYRMNVLLT